MTTRKNIAAMLVIALAGAFWAGSLAAAYVAVAGAGMFYLLHAIEYRVIKLLDHHGIKVTDAEIAQD
jgi:hypothetical protein